MANLNRRLTSISTFPRSGPPPGRRLVALLLSAALALASISPGFAVAGEADSEGEGSTPPIEVPVGPPDFDPGGEEEGLEEEVPATDEEGTVVEPEAEAEIEAPEPVEVTGTTEEAPVEAPPPPPVADPQPEEAEPVQQQEAEEPSEPVANAEILAPRSQPGAGSAATESAASDAPPPAEPIQQSEAPPPPSHGGDAPSHPDRPDRDLVGADSYVVRPGDCLWHIAAAMLPPGSDARVIAGTVLDLWHLNRARIGSDPNLIYPGTVLRLR